MKSRRGRSLVVLLLAGLLLLAFLGCKKEEEPAKIAYAEGVTIIDDADAFQKAINEQMNAPAIALEYKSEVTSSDGKTFQCYIANAEANEYDMYINIYADQELTDELYLSGLLRPGTALNEITLNHALEPGTATVYVIFTQVEEDQSTTHAQTMIAMDFVVDQ